jgi:predicted DNA binding protein
VVSRRSGIPTLEQDAEPAETISDEEFYNKEVDPILDKISEQGIQSLTPRERRILEAARQRMDRK